MITSSVLTTSGPVPINAYRPDEFTYEPLHFSRKTKNKKHVYYCDEFATFDTETSHTDTASWIYQWSVKFDRRYLYGRTPSDFIELLKALQVHYNLSDERKIFIIIHNASYEMQFLKHYLRIYDATMRGGSDEMEILAIDKHTYISVDIFGFRFICSYKLSNLNLDLFAKNYADHFRKATGEIDYRILHYPDEELDASNWFYQFSDVAAQHDAIKGLLRIHGYKLISDAPMTSTGFVRTRCREASRGELFWRKVFRRSALTLEQYNLAHQVFMGGLTICSYKYSDVTVRVGKEYNGKIYDTIGHVDFASSYPTRQMLDYFPKGAPTWYGSVESDEELQELLDNYCCMFVLHAYDVHIKPGVTAPYIPSSKILYPKTKKGILKLNGKVVFAEEMAIAVTEIDYKWIMKQYDIKGDKFIDKMLIFERGEMPKFLKKEIMYYYENKCKLKKADPRLYLASKALLNSIYGMSATAIIRQEYKYDDEMILDKRNTKTDEEKLTQYYESRNSFLPYQYGIFTTAHSRDALMTLIESIGYDKFLYCDTDSVFYLSDPEAEAAINEYNKGIRKRAIEAGAYYENKVLGVAEHEPNLTAFRGLHAKCYAMIEDGKLSVTIAGINRSATKWIDGPGFTTLHTMTNAEELGDIDNLKDGFTFKHCGSARIIYIEDWPHGEVINGHKVDLASGSIIKDIEKTISNTMFTVGENYEFLHIKQDGIL